MLVGGGSVRSGGLDISNLMKPALARGQLHCIGATTLDEHRKYFEKDSALERRFQPVMVDEPSAPEALVILEGLKVGTCHSIVIAGLQPESIKVLVNHDSIAFSNVSRWAPVIALSLHNLILTAPRCLS